MIIQTHQADRLRRFVRIVTLFCCCLLLIGIPASAARMGSVDVNGSEVAYQALYEAYTEAASGDDAVVCKFTVSNPTAGKNGALCRIILPQSQNVYLYMDAGDLAVMRYDGSEYKKFSVDYQLSSNTTYTLCVFSDGLVFFDGIRCYTYSGNLYGFTDVIAGWSDESNVFSTTLTKEASTTTEDTTEDTADSSVSAAAEQPATVSTTAASLYPPIWVILALVLGVSSNLVALLALRSSNMALHTVRRSMPYGKRPPKPAAQQKPPAKKPAPPKRPPQQKKKQPAAARTAPRPKPSPPPAIPQPQPPAKPKQKPTIFYPPEPPKEQPAPAEQQAGPFAQPYDLYTGSFWKSYAERFKSYRFGDPARGYCTFVRGSSLASDLFVLSSDSFIWLNPIRFHTTSSKHGVRIRVAEAAGISMAFDFCHVDTGERELSLAQDVEMVNFRPARVVQGSHGAYELAERGIVVFDEMRT